MMLNEDQQIQFNQLWMEAQATVTAYVRSVVRDADLTKDIVQNTALVLLRKYEDWDSSREFLPWALGFAKFELLSHRRDTGRSRIVFDDTLLDAITVAWSEVTSEIDREQSALQACLEKLDAKARDMVRLRYSDELRMSQVAEKLGTTAGAARISMMRIRHQLLNCVNRQLQNSGEHQ